MAFDLFKLAGSIFIDTSEADNSLHKTDTNAVGFGETLGKVGNVALGTAKFIADMGITAVGALADTAMSAADTADNIDKMSQRLGISTDAFQELDYILARNDVEINSFQTGMKSLLKNMDGVAEGNKTATENFELLGVAVTDASGKMRSQEEVLWDTIEAFQGMEEGAEKSRLAQELFGKQGQEIMPMLNSSKGALEELRNQAHELGLVMSEEAVKSGAEFSDAMTDLQSSFEMLQTNLGTAMLPLLTDLVNLLVDNMPTIQNLVGQFTPIITQMLQNLMPTLMALVNNILPIVEGIQAEVLPIMQEFAMSLLPIIIQLIQKLAPFIAELVVKLLPVAMTMIVQMMPLLDALIPLLDPIIDCTLELIDVLTPILTELMPPLVEIITLLLSDAIVPLVNFIMGDLTHAINHLIGALLEELVASFKDCFELVLHVIELFKDMSVGNFEEVRDDILVIVGDLLKGVVNNFVATYNTVVNVINSLVQDVTSAFNKVSGMFSFGGGTANIKVPKIPNIPRLAEGGTVASAGTVLVGEEAPEFLDLPAGARVTPLDKAGIGLTKDDLEEAFVNALSRITIPIELQTNDDALFEKVVSKNTEFRRRHSGMSALA